MLTNEGAGLLLFPFENHLVGCQTDQFKFGKRWWERKISLLLPTFLAGEIKLGESTGTFIFCLHLAPYKLMGVWLQLLWEVSCDSPFTLPIEEGANHGHLLSASAWLTAGVEAVSVAAGGAGEELKADLIPLVLSCHLRPEPEGEWEADSLPSALWQATNMSLYCFNLPLPSSCLGYRPLCLGKKGFSRIQRQLPLPPSKWLICSPGPPSPSLAAAQGPLAHKTSIGQVLLLMGSSRGSVGDTGQVHRISLGLAGLMPYRSFVPEVCVCAHTHVSMFMCLFPLKEVLQLVYLVWHQLFGRWQLFR